MEQLLHAGLSALGPPTEGIPSLMRYARTSIQRSFIRTTY